MKMLVRTLSGIALALLVSTMSPYSGTSIAANSEFVESTGILAIAKGQGRLVRLSKAASSVFIANPEIADVTVKSSRMVYVFGIKAGTTSLFAVDSSENVIADISVDVTHDLDGLARSIKATVPDTAIEVQSVSGGLVISGDVPSATDAENIRRLAMRFLSEGEEVINQIHVTDPNQVNVRVRIAEVSRTAVRQLGLNFNISKGDFLFTSGETFLANPGALAGAGPFELVGNQAGAGLLSDITLGSATMSFLFDTLEEIGLAKTLAEPNLTAISGETASFLAGGEFPIPVAQEDSAITVEFKEFGVSLAFTPTVLSGNRISMRVRPEVSQLSDAGAVQVNGLNVSALTTRRAETTIELASGQSFAIAGLLSEDFQDSVRQIPYLGDVPLLGELFKSEAFRRNETELMILVTPYIVQPLETARNLPLPTDPLTKSQVEIATARERRTSARLSRTVQVPISPAGSTQTGEVTYMLD